MCVLFTRNPEYRKNYNKTRIITNPEDANNNKTTPENEIVARHDQIAEEIWKNNN